MKDYHLTIKIRNNYLLQAMRGAGFRTVAELSRATGVSQQTIGQFMIMRSIPYESRKGRPTSKFRKSILQLAKFFNKLPEDLFPPQHLVKALERNTAEAELDLADFARYLQADSPPTPEIEYMQQELSLTVQDALKTLTPQEAQVLRYRFGLEGEEELGLEEIGQKYTVSRERIRQIEAKALRKLNHPSRRGLLEDFIDV